MEKPDRVFILCLNDYDGRKEIVDIFYDEGKAKWELEHNTPVVISGGELEIETYSVNDA